MSSHPSRIPQAAGHSQGPPKLTWDSLLVPLIAVAAPMLVALFPLIDWLVGTPGASTEWRESFSIFFMAIVLEAVPFILMGAFLSGLMEIWLPADLLPRLTAKAGVWGLPLVALASPFFPVCECGVVMVVRGLIRKGLPLPHAIVYLLAAPILNPTVLASTYIAFQDWTYPLARALGGIAIALVAGWVISLLPAKKLYKAEPLPGLATLDEACGCGHDHSHDHGHVALPGWLNRWGQVAGRVTSDFLDMLPYFLIGVTIASAMKTFINPDALMDLGEGSVSGPFVMMSAAFVLSLCAEADAFVAASFIEFSFPAVMGFLILGPMFDIKLLMMYRPIFTWRTVLLLAVLVWLGVAGFVALLGAEL
jgi:uncharacterized membrane protein YraQ (UPF0718 family)